MKIDVQGHRVVVDQIICNDGVLVSAWDAIRRAPQDDFDRYDNPFEGKCTLRKEYKIASKSTSITRLIGRLENEITRAREWFDEPDLVIDTDRHYCSVFRYRAGDHLSVHLDAGIHPMNGLRKHVTALLYLSELESGEGGELELWRPDHPTWASLASESQADSWHHQAELVAAERLAMITPSFGQLVMFENNDDAWHGIADYMGDKARILITVSFLSPAVDRWASRRTRAYFIPRANEEWTEETYRLRDQRCDPERFASVYQVGAKM